MANTLDRTRPHEPVPSSAALKRRRPLLFLLAGLVLASVLAVVLFAGIGAPGGPQDVAPGLNQASANELNLEMQISSRPMPNFTLTDQHNRTVSLNQFRGKSVVLSFNDDRCPDICTLLAEDVIAADRDLGPAASHIEFVAVNVNPYYPQVSAVRSWSDEHGLGHLANWEFLNGPASALATIWRHYGVTVVPDPTTRTVVHSTELFFLGPDGKQKAIGSFGLASADTATYAHALAQMAEDSLPSSNRTSVGGPSALNRTQSATAIGATAPAFALPTLGAPQHQLALRSLRGQWVFINFWSSTCTACVHEMPAIQTAFQALGKTVRFIGIDVADRPQTADGFVKARGVSYTLLSDASGRVAQSYQVAELPYSVVITPKGQLSILHPGAMTTEQIEYLLKNLDPRLGAS